MCGITGIFNFDPGRPVDVDLLHAMNATITHRGPDEDGFLVRGPVGMGNRRLSIIGLADGRQPIANEDETVWTVFNGEIYNYPDLRRELEGRGHRFRTHTDTEVLVHLYEDHGPEFVRHLNGMFAIALWDDRRARLLLYRDRIGEKPLYWVRLNGRLLFASEIKALLCEPALDRTLSAPALCDYLAFQYNARAQTIFRDVRRLQPGRTLEISATGVQERTWWRIPTTPPPQRTEAEWIATFEELMDDAVRRRLMSDVPLGAFLSGGLDSSYVVGLMARIAERPVSTFSVGFRVPGGYDESGYAEGVARSFRTDHHTLVVDAFNVAELLPTTVYSLDEPVADYAAIPTFLLSRFAREHVKVVLTGEGADELFAGYDRYRLPRLLDTWTRMPTLVRRIASDLAGPLAPARIRKALAAGALDPLGGYVHVQSIFRRRELDELLVPELTAHLAGEPEHPDLRALFAHSDGLETLNRYLHADLATWLPEDLLMKVDKMSMSVGLEARVPYLDHRIVELVATMPAGLKWRRGGKYLLRRAAARVVPEDVLARPKHGFTLPLRRWFRHELRDLVAGLLTGPRARTRGIFRPPGVRALWDSYLAGDESRFMPVWVLLNFEVWCRVFLDGDREALDVGRS